MMEPQESQAGSPTRSQEPAPPRIVITVGLPGSGKSTYVGKLCKYPLSSDFFRELLLDDVAEQSRNRQIFAVVRHFLKLRIQARRPVTYVDATHLTVGERRPYVKLAELYSATVEVLYFDVPLAVCQERNLRRDRVVDDEVMRRFAAKLAPPRREEGFASITVITD